MVLQRTFKDHVKDKIWLEMSIFSVFPQLSLFKVCVIFILWGNTAVPAPSAETLKYASHVMNFPNLL